MQKMMRFLLPFLATAILVNCTSHAVITPEPLKSGESYYGMAFSVENVLPQVVVRRGLSDKADMGLRIGLLPVHGSGVDLSLLLRDEGKRLHTLNLAATYAEQSAFEATYYNVKRKERTKTVRRDGKVFKQTDTKIFNYGYTGLRYMYLPTGYWGDKVSLFGVLYGMNFKGDWGLEMGYFHDFSGRVPVSDYNLDPRLAPLTGLSLRVWLGRIRKS